jgi:hypothetical protein
MVSLPKIFPRRDRQSGLHRFAIHATLAALGSHRGCTLAPLTLAGRSPHCVCSLDKWLRLTQWVKLNASNFLSKFMKLGSAWSGQLPDLG